MQLPATIRRLADKMLLAQLRRARSLVSLSPAIFGFGLMIFVAGDGNAPAQNDTRTMSQASPVFHIQTNNSVIRLSGVVSSVAHESILRQRTNHLFPERAHQFDFRQADALPPGWSLITELSLRVAAESFSSTIEVRPSHVSVVGIAAADSDWRKQLAFLGRYLPQDMRVDERMSEIGSLESHEQQCSAVLAAALSQRPLEFATDSDLPGSNAIALLESVAQIAVDCPHAQILIVSHTDDTGTASANQLLSQRRAEAVAARLQALGIRRERITAIGRGAAEPLTPGSSTAARKRNRRVELSFKFAEP